MVLLGNSSIHLFQGINGKDSSHLQGSYCWHSGKGRKARTTWCFTMARHIFSSQTTIASNIAHYTHEMFAQIILLLNSNTMKCTATKRVFSRAISCG